MLKVLYIGNNEKLITLLSKKVKNLIVKNDISNQCLFNQDNYNLIIIDENLYKEKLQNFLCLNHLSNLIILTEQIEKNLKNSCNINYFLNNLNILLENYIFKSEINDHNAFYLSNYKELEYKLLNEKKLLNIHLYNLDYYYKNYGYIFLKEYLENFIINLLKELTDKEQLYILGQSDYFITSINKNKQELEMLAKRIINKFKNSPLEIQEVIVKYKFKIVLSIEDNHINLIKKTLNNLNSTKDFFTLNSNHKDTLEEIQDTNLIISKKLKTAFIEGNFETYFQPIQNNNNNKIEIYECLIRKKDSLLKPNQFIPILQRTNLTYLVTYTIIDQAFKYCQKNGYSNYISINICIEDLENVQFINYIKNKQKKYGIQNQKIIFEIVESVSLVSNNYIINQLEILKEYGYKIALDKFGIYNSNFSILFELDIDFIKIDHLFIDKINDIKYYKIIKGLVALAHSMNIKVIGEFIKDKEIQNKILELGIDYSQGYYIGQPKKEMI